MTGRPAQRRRRTTIAALALTVPLVATACSAESESTNKPASEASASAAADASGYSGDIGDPGDDLLERVRVGATFTGATLAASWRLPKSYETEPLVNNKAASTGDDGIFKIEIGGGPATAEKLTELAEDTKASAEAEGQEAELSEVTINGLDYTVVSHGKESVSMRTFLHKPDGGEWLYLVRFTADKSLADTPPKRLDELNQLLASFEFEAE